MQPVFTLLCGAPPNVRKGCQERFPGRLAITSLVDAAKLLCSPLRAVYAPRRSILDTVFRPDHDVPALDFGRNIVEDLLAGLHSSHPHVADLSDLTFRLLIAVVKFLAKRLAVDVLKGPSVHAHCLRSCIMLPMAGGRH
jgi:hypothetical protein